MSKLFFIFRNGLNLYNSQDTAYVETDDYNLINTVY